ncbi:MAG: serine protease [Elusimicrobiota bacterium]
MNTSKLPVLILLAALTASPARSMPVYNGDDRQDPYEVEDREALALADSTVALFPSDKVSFRGNRAMLKTRAFGKEAGLCEGERFSEQRAGADCSGVLVGPDLVLTAGHCVRSNTLCAMTSFVFGFALSTEDSALRSVPASEVYSCASLVGHEAEAKGADWAVVRLDRPVRGHRPLKVERRKVARGMPLMVVGYPSGLPVKVAGGASVTDDTPEAYFKTDLDTFHGNSGSPVFNARTKGIVGVLVRGEDDFELVDLPGGKQCMKTRRCAGADCRGEDVTRVSRFAHLIPNGIQTRFQDSASESMSFSDLEDLAGGSK